MVCPVWGSLYIQRFLRYAVASLLAPPNLPQWPYGKETTLYCYTTPEDWAHLAVYEAWHLLQRYVAVERRPAPIHVSPNAYHCLSLVQQDALAQAYQAQHSLIFIHPDHVYSSHTLAFLAACIAKEAECVLSPGLRVNESTCEKQLAAYRHGHALNIDETMSTACVITHMHPECCGYFWYADQFNCHGPSAVYYWENETTFCGHHYDLNPLYIAEPQPMPKPANVSYPTLDLHYVERWDSLVSQPSRLSRIYLPWQTEMVSLSMTPETYDTTGWTKPLAYMQRPRHVLSYIQRLYHSPFKQWCFQQVLRFLGPPKLAATQPKQEAPFTLYQQMAPYRPWFVPSRMIQLEDWILAENYTGLLAAWQDSTFQKGLLSIIDPMLAGYYYPVALAYYHLGHWNELNAFIQAQRVLYQQADFSILRLRPAYWGYLPEPDQSVTRRQEPYHLLFWPDQPFDWFGLQESGDWLVFGTSHLQCPQNWPSHLSFADLEENTSASVLSQFYGLLAGAHQVVIHTDLQPVLQDAVLYRLLRGQSFQIICQPDS